LDFEQAMTSSLERLLEHLAVAKKAKGPDQLLSLADLGQTVRRLKEELGEIHARAVRGAKIITNRLKPRRRLCCSFTEWCESWK
jgi:hypothetical protein